MRELSVVCLVSATVTLGNKHSKLSKLAALAVASLSLVLHSCPAFVGDLEFSWGKESDTRSCSNVKF